MRVALGGKGEPRDEFALEGSGVDTSGEVPIVLLLENGEVFHPEDYISLGYTHCEVWCVGASGGRGGDGFRSQGGAGGGGGLHRVTVALADLPADCPVVVGQAGTDGADDNGQTPYLYELNSDNYIRIPTAIRQNPSWIPATAGTDGGASSFNGTTCRASGGKAGKPVKISTPFLSPTGGEPRQIFYKTSGGDGGAGGRGASSVAGGGGAAGYSEAIGDPVFPAEYVSHWEPHKPKDGAWDGAIGEGGGGGLGGTLRYVVHQDVEGV